MPPDISSAPYMVLEKTLRDPTPSVNPDDRFAQELRRLMGAFHNAAAAGSAGATFGQVQGGRRASAIHVRIFAAADPTVIRATVFKVEDGPAVRAALAKWAEELSLRPVWGRKWF